METETDWDSIGHGLPRIRHGMSMEVSDACREILRQYREAGFDHCASLPYRGPHYVTYERGEFYLRPFGDWAEFRHSFDVRLDYTAPDQESMWVFSVRF
jgi:hypothetical protein